MSISLSDSQNPSEERDRDSSDSFEPSLAVLKCKRLRGCNYDVTKHKQYDTKDTYFFIEKLLIVFPTFKINEIDP